MDHCAAWFLKKKQSQPSGREANGCLSMGLLNVPEALLKVQESLDAPSKVARYWRVLAKSRGGLGAFGQKGGNWRNGWLFGFPRFV